MYRQENSVLVIEYSEYSSAVRGYVLALSQNNGGIFKKCTHILLIPSQKTKGIIAPSCIRVYTFWEKGSKGRSDWDDKIVCRFLSSFPPFAASTLLDCPCTR